MCFNLHAFADVYYSSLESGPEHIDTAGGYFYIADVFVMQGQTEHALAFYDKVRACARSRSEEREREKRRKGKRTRGRERKKKCNVERESVIVKRGHSPFPSFFPHNTTRSYYPHTSLARPLACLLACSLARLGG